MGLAIGNGSPPFRRTSSRSSWQGSTSSSFRYTERTRAPAAAKSSATSMPISVGSGPSSAGIWRSCGKQFGNEPLRRITT